MATPGKNKTNFKTYEASTRLLAAVIATTNVKLDYAELAKHVGGGATKDAINHRLRPIKQLAKMQVACIRKGEDPGDLPIDKGALAELVGEGATAVAMEHRMRAIKQLAKEFAAKLDKKKKGEESDKSPTGRGEIQKLFGESTPSGIEWQFRDIKNLGKAQQDAVKKGENPATLPVSGTPAGRKKAAGANTPGSGATARTPGTGARGRKRTAPAALAPLDSDESDGDPETPTKRPVAKKARTTAATPTPHKSNGNITTPNYTPTKTTIDIPAGVAAAWAPDWAPDISSRLNGASTSATVHSTEAFNNGAQMSTTHSAQYHVQTTPQRVTNLAKVIKKEPTVNTNPFLGAIHISALNEGDDLEDGEI
ncbi:hypothetical protein F5Y09DRAFT_233784 [Xylaria sp. FL1042]|nr:hypothetical protein F5Y09DRAFT_233784 [Xylaria sp. FL1042]